MFCKKFIFGVLMMLLSLPGYANQPYDSDLLIFVSFSMPEESLKLWAEQASHLGCPLLLRGFVDNDLTKTTAKTQSLFGEKANVDNVFLIRCWTLRGRMFPVLQSGWFAEDESWRY